MLGEAHRAADLVADPQPPLLGRADAVSALGHNVLQAEEWLKRRGQRLPASLAEIRPGTAGRRVEIAALRAALGCRHGDVAPLALDGQNDLRDPVARPFVVDDRPRPELLDGQKARTGKEFIAPATIPAAGDVCRQRQAREVVTPAGIPRSQSSDNCRDTLDRALRLSQELELGLCLCPELPSPAALVLAARGVRDDLVLEGLLASRRPVESSPPRASAVRSRRTAWNSLTAPRFRRGPPQRPDTVECAMPPAPVPGAGRST